jgi:hypothetical protein
VKGTLHAVADDLAAAVADVCAEVPAVAREQVQHTLAVAIGHQVLAEVPQRPDLAARKLSGPADHEPAVMRWLRNRLKPWWFRSRLRNSAGTVTLADHAASGVDRAAAGAGVLTKLSRTIPCTVRFVPTLRHAISQCPTDTIDVNPERSVNLSVALQVWPARNSMIDYGTWWVCC